MRSVDGNRLYSIGELARRTGLSVKTIRFYSDTGVVPPTDRTPSGYRLYDIASVSRLELVRTLRELGAGLEDIRRVLESETSLGQLAHAHLGLVEQQMRVLRTRRAVLRAVVKQNSTTEEMRLMHKLANLSDEERNRIIDEFWDEVTEGIDVNQDFIDWMRSAKPNLPEDPSGDQVEAWIELAELVGDQSFRDLVRCVTAENAQSGNASTTDDFSPERIKRFWATQAKVTEFRKAGTAPEDAQAQELMSTLVDQMRETWAGPVGELRERIADHFEQHDPRMSRYWELLATINGWPQPATLSAADTQWLVAALRVS